MGLGCKFTWQSKQQPMENSYSSIKRDIASTIGEENTTFTHPAVIDDYAFFLAEFSDYNVLNKYYLLVGDISHNCSLLIYLSVSVFDFGDLFNRLKWYLLEKKTSFAIPGNRNVHDLLNNGGLGSNEIGKIIIFFPKSSEEAESISNELAKVQDYSGPEVEGAYPLTGSIYAQMFNTKANFKWPFKDFKKLTLRKEPKKINRYVITNRLKGDAKGNVYKCLELKNWFNIKWCILKQGKFAQCPDEYGRTIADRLSWQFNLLKRFEPSNYFPKVYDFFYFANDSYLAMEHIDGLNLYEFSNRKKQGLAWTALSIENQRSILKCLLKVIEIVSHMHDHGVIHRDINPGNFLIEENGSVKGIDIELAYEINGSTIKKPFTYGTPGYLSPQQASFCTPETSDDVYGIGALLIKILTGLSPSRWSGNGAESVSKSLLFFIGNYSVAAMIATCLDTDAKLRPTLPLVSHVLELYDAILLTSTTPIDPILKTDSKLLEKVIQQSLNFLASPILQSNEGHWIAKVENENHDLANELMLYDSNPFFESGAAGALYVCALCERQKFDTVGIAHSLFENLGLLERSIANAEHLKSGLFDGMTGIGVVLNELALSGLISNDILLCDKVFKCTSGTSKKLNLSGGLAGIGLALLNIGGNQKLPNQNETVHTIVRSIINEQQKDGSWIVRRNEDDLQGIKLFGLFNGIAGILFFLIEYYRLYPSESLETSIHHGLNYLLKKRKLNNGHQCWPTSEFNDNFDPWLEDGYMGIAITFIKAHQAFNSDSYKNAVLTAFNCNPKFLSSNYLSLGNGIAGFLIAYTFAYTTFEDLEWQERSSYIIGILLNTYRETEAGIYWIEGNSSNPTADYLNGNAGIIYALLYALYPKKIDLFFCPN